MHREMRSGKAYHRWGQSLVMAISTSPASGVFGEKENESEEKKIPICPETWKKGVARAKSSSASNFNY
jgi:hypothetical protein